MWVTGGRVGALGAHPHPYWIVVLPIAASRGTIAGMIAALMGMTLEIVGLAQIGQLELSQLFDLGPFGQGVLFLGAAFLIGELHDSHARRFRQLGEVLDDEREETARLRHEHAVLEAAVHHLRRTVQERPSLRRSLLNGAVRIESRTREALAAAILDLVREQCHASKASVWIVDAERHPHLMRTSGWSGPEEPQRIEALRGSARIAEALENASPLNGLLDHEAPPLEEPLLVAPLADGQGVLWGLLCLDDIEPVYLTTETTEIFFGLADWMSAALTRIDREHRSPQRRGRLPDAERLGERLWLEYDRAARYGAPLRLVGVQVMPDANGERAKQKDADEVLREELERYPWGHPPYRFGYPGCYMVVAPLVHDRELTELTEHLARPDAYDGVVFRTFVVTLDGDAPDLPALIDASAQRFREVSPLPLAAKPPVRIPASHRVGNAHDMFQRLLFEYALADRTHRPLQAVALQITRGNGAGIRALVLDATRATGALRPIDALYHLGDRLFVLLLPFTEREGADIGVRRFIQILEERNPGAPYLPVEARAVKPGRLLDGQLEDLDEEDA